MSDQQLRLVASIKDGASAGIRAIGKQLKSVRVEPGMAQAQKWVRGLNEDVAKFKQSSATITSVMTSMGVGGLAAAASVGTLVATFKDLAEHTLNIKELGREIGITTTELRAMERAGQHFGFDPSQMEGALKRLAGLMPIFRRGGNNELTQALARAPDLMAKVRGEADDTAAAFKDIMGYVGKLQNPQDRIKFYEQIFGNGDLEKLNADGAGGFDAQVAKYRQMLAPQTQAMEKQAQALRDAVVDFNASLENLELKAGPTFYRWMTAAVQQLDTVLEKIERHPADAGALAGVGVGAIAAIRLQRRIMAGSMLAGGSDMRAAAGSLSGAAGGIDKSAVALNEAAIALKEAAAALGRGGGGPSRGTPPAEPTKPGVPEVVENAPKGFFGAGGLKGLGGSIMEGLFGAMIYQAGEHAMNAVLGWTPKDQKTLDHATSLPNVWKDVQDQLGGGLKNSRVKDDAFPASEPRTSTLSPESYWARKRVYLGLAAPAYHPADDDRLSRARASDASAPSATDAIFTLGSLEKPVTHLVGTLKTAAAEAEADGIKPAAFHPAGLGGASSLDPVATIAAGTKEGVLAALRELQGGAPDDGSTARGGIIPASFGGGGSGGRAPSIRFGRQHSSAPYDDGGPTPTGAHDPLKDLIAAHETGGTGAAGYDTVYGHAERGGPMAPSRPISQMTIADVLAYQREMKPRAGAAAFPVGRAQWTESTLRGLTRGMDPNTVFSPDVQEKLFDRSIAGRMGQGTGGFRSEWDSLRAVPDGEIERAMEGHREALRSGAANVADAVKAGPDGIAGHVRGNLRIGDETYAYGSGGVRGSAHVPFGDYPINPDSGNPWGRAHNAMDVNGNGSIWDQALGRMRTGIEMHEAHSANMVTEGCLSFLKEQYPQIKQRVREMIAKTGHAYLHIDEHGASITPTKDRPDLDQEKLRAGLTGSKSVKIDGGVEAHVHLHEGRVAKASARSNGAVREARITVRSGPQRTFTV